METPVTVDQSSPLEWEGQTINNNGDIYNIMKRSTPDKAVEFTQKLRERYGKTDADALIFKGAFIETATVQESASILSKMLGGDFSGEFYITEAPQDEYGNTAMSTSVLKVKIAENNVGDNTYINLVVLGPDEISSKWDLISPLVRRYFPVEGPERKLDRNEWKKLVDFKSSA